MVPKSSLLNAELNRLRGSVVFFYMIVLIFCLNVSSEGASQQAISLQTKSDVLGSGVLSGSWSALYVGILSLIVAVLLVATQYLKLKRARIELKQRLDHPEIGIIEGIFQRCDCPLAVACAELLCLESCKTFEQAAKRLESARRNIVNLAATPMPGIEGMQITLAKICEGLLKQVLVGPGDYLLIETRTLECYAAFPPLLTEVGLGQAVSDCQRWLHPRPGREHLRTETVRILLPLLLNRHPNNEALMKLYADLMGNAGAAPTSHDVDVLQAALLGLEVLPDLSSANLSRLLQAGFHLACRHWDLFGMGWSHAIYTSLRGDRLAQEALRELVGLVSAHIRSQEYDILENPSRQREYVDLCGVIVESHGRLGINRRPRPKNRHVVQANPGIKVRLTPLGNHNGSKYISGNLGNFSLNSKPWEAGAWITSGEGSIFPGCSEHAWAVARLIIDAGLDGEIMLESIQVKGPISENPHNNPYGHNHGFRVKFGELSSENEAKLNKLAKRFPVTR
jgi:hypothetical protein